MKTLRKSFEPSGIKKAKLKYKDYNTGQAQSRETLRIPLKQNYSTAAVKKKVEQPESVPGLNIPY